MAIVRYTPRATKVMSAAKKLAISFNGNSIEPEHVLLALVRSEQSKGARALVARYPNALEEIDAELCHAIVADTAVSLGAGPGQSELLQEVVRRAIRFAQNTGSSCVGTEHLLLGVCRAEKNVAGKLLARRGYSLEVLQAAIQTAYGRAGAA